LTLPRQLFYNRPMQTAPQDNIIPFNFREVRLKEACWLDGKPYFTRRAIGEFLEYAKPDFSINWLVKRNQHVKEFATYVKLTCVEGGREVTRKIEVYDPIGLQLIINKSNQPKAIQFQVAVAKLVMAYVSGKLLPSRWSPKGDYAAIRQILSTPGNFKRRALIKDFAEREEISISTAYRRIGKFERLKTLSGKPRRSRATL